LNAVRTERDEIDRQLEELRRQLESARAASVDSEAMAGWDAERESYEKKQSELTDELDQYRNQVGRLESTLADLQAENARLNHELETLPAGGTATSEDVDEWKQRYQMAMQDVQELKQRNETLLRKLEQSESAPADSATDASDWESLKQRMLSELEGFDDSTPEAREEKMTIEGSMRIMDEVVAEKDAEIAELQRMLNEQSNRVGEVAVGAAAIAEMLDQDELITEERANLKRLQDEWREKLRKAEVELATERARLARERSGMADEIAELKAERKRLEELKAELGPAGANSKKPAKGGRWFARLGLNKDE